MTQPPEETIRRVALRLLALAQSGLTYVHDPFDEERYRETASLGAELMALMVAEPLGTLRRDLVAETGYATPKLDVRGALFDDEGRVLLVQERADGLWALPGGWAEVGDSPSEAVEKEIREESGYGARAVKLAAVLDRDRQGHVPALPVAIYKLLFVCEWDGEPPVTAQESETLAVGWFPLTELPPLSLGRVLPGQLEMLARANADRSLPAVFD